MIWLSIIQNEGLLVLAETLVIIIGSMLLGILLAWFFWGKLKEDKIELQSIVDEEKRKQEDLRDQISQLLHEREQLQHEMADVRAKLDTQSKLIFDQNNRLFIAERDSNQHREMADSLQATIDSYQHRLRIIEEELTKAKAEQVIPKKLKKVLASSANYEHVSQLLGRQVTENDLTLIAGIGPKTASLLKDHKIKTWEKLAKTPIADLREILEEAGGTYKSLDPSAWARQAKMAAKSEWRKLRVFQETLKNKE
jgi:predicted flap endonuclease-1-like 5' DNA nuclease